MASGNQDRLSTSGEFLGYGEREGQLSEAEFLALYPEGVFRPTPPSWVEVRGVPLPPAVAKALLEQESKVA